MPANQSLAQLATRAADLHREGKLAEAIAFYETILRAEPRNANALHYSGVAHYQLGDLARAVARLRAAVDVDGTQADALCNLGLVLQAMGRGAEGLEALERAARVEPRAPDVLGNLAVAYHAAGRHAEAEAAARRLIALDATHARAWFILSLALQTQGRMLEALEAATRAAGLAPEEEGFVGVKAQLERGIGAPQKARQTLESALARNPLSTPLRFELGSVLEYQLASLPEAATAYEQVVRIDPGHGPALSQLAFLRGRLADWRNRDELTAQYRKAVEAGAATLSPFAFLSLPSTRAEQRTCARTWTAPLSADRDPARRRISTARRLRIGYLSADFHNHATAFLAAGLFEHHDRARFEVVAYSTGPDDRSSMRARLTRAFDRFVDVRGRHPLAVAEAIRGDRIDILVDLKGHTQDATPIVVAQRPAPIQVHYLGYPGTIEGGLVDYLIGDAVVTPQAHAADYAEAIATLPHTYQVNDRNRPIADTPPRADLGLPGQGVVFASFNQTYKINPRVFDAWMAILARVPDSVLWLLKKTEDDPAQANLRREAQARGVDPARLVFAKHRPNPEYLALYRHADLFLDTWPYNAHTTASDALWAGCPVLTLRGETFAGRVAESLLTAVGLPELVAANVDDYVARAVALAGNRDERARLAAHLAGPGRASPLFDTAATTRALEAAYETMVAQYRRGVRESFRVEE
ncbi:MAG: tetratricopeptide repeat protein, partial [Burkholderiales bacterium]|nr:tetratricopeptide repeat protein [Burkholderiales bacterium]